MNSSNVALLGGRRAEAERQFSDFIANGITGICIRQWHHQRRGWYVVVDSTYEAIYSDPDEVSE